MRRWSNAVLAFATGAILAVAAFLTPAEAGHSTHTQLGLDGCTLLSWTGIPCPMCGMTTSFALMADLRLFDAFINQPFSVVLFGATVITFCLSGLELVNPNDRWTKVGLAIAPYEVRIAVVAFVCLVLAWVYKAWLLW